MASRWCVPSRPGSIAIPTPGQFVLTGSSNFLTVLEYMRDTLGSSFMAGVVLYGGQHVLPFGNRLMAAPISALWEL